MIGSSDILKAGILIVDDQPANISLLERMLRDAGYVSIASTMDPREVCELYRRNRYGLILLDLQMPLMDGFQVMEGLKEIETGGYIPVLAITAQPGHKLRALKAGAMDFVSKPFDLGEVLARVHNMLEVRLLHLQNKSLLDQVVAEQGNSRQGLLALGASELRYRRLFETAKDGILILDAGTGMVVDVNPFLITLLGFSREQFLGKAIWELGFFKDIVANEDKFAELRETEYVRYEHLPLETIDGRRIDVEFVSNVYLVDGCKVIQCNVRDVSARIAAEKSLRQLHAELEQRVNERTIELKAANMELEAFSYSVSHDLRAPLRHIDGFAQKLQRHLGGGLDDTGRRLIGTIVESARTMGRLIDALLAFAQVGRVEMRRTRVNLDEIVAETRRNLGGEINGRAITWQVAPLPEVEGDATLLRQVFANLLGNAVKYSRNRAMARIEVGAQPGANGDIVVSVSDNGAGFDMAYAGKLFGVFQRLHGNSEFEGTGVGLASVRRIVERHGGRIWAEGAVDAGATFRFSLHAARP